MRCHCFSRTWLSMYRNSLVPSKRGPIGIGHPPLALETLQRLLIGLVIALAMRDRHADHLPGIIAARERRVGALDPQMHVRADEFQPRVAHQHTGQEPRLAEDLEAV